MGDDERFDYFYKFVSSGKCAADDPRGPRGTTSTLLDDGTLYVARFTGDSPPAEIDGTGKLPSTARSTAAASGSRWSAAQVVRAGITAEEVLLFTRLAADKVGATKMDRPEDVEPSPGPGKVYIA